MLSSIINIALIYIGMVFLLMVSILGFIRLYIEYKFRQKL